MCQLLRHPFITNEDVIDIPAAPRAAVSQEERARIVKQAVNIREDDLASIASPKSIKPAIEVDSSGDDSEYATNGQNPKAPFSFVSKQPTPQKEKEKGRMEKFKETIKSGAHSSSAKKEKQSKGNS